MEEKAKCKNCTNEIIEEMASCDNCVCKVVCYERANIEEIEGKESDAMKSWEEYVKQYGCQYYQPKIHEGSVVLDRQEHQKYCAYKIIEPQIKGCLDRERELERKLKELEEQRDRQAYIAEDLIQEKHRWTEQARKEAVKEALQELYEQIDEKTPKWVKVQIEMIAKRNGVEVEE